MTFVSLDDARAYCTAQQKRLPHAYEWQHFAQGNDGRLYPWGATGDVAGATPTAQLHAPLENNNFSNPGPEPIGQYPRGASPFGVEDLVYGNFCNNSPSPMLIAHADRTVMHHVFWAMTLAVSC